MSNIKIYTVFKGTDKEFTGTLPEIANHFNINYSTLYNRLKRQNLSLEEVIDRKNIVINKEKEKYLNQTKLMNCGMKCIIVEYFNCHNITVQFEDGMIIKNRNYFDFKIGAIANPNLKKDYSKRLGEIKLMRNGQKAKIVEYVNRNNIAIEFEDGTIVKDKAYSSFKNGTIKNPNLMNIKMIKAKEKHLNETRIMNCGIKCTIIEYINSKNITVQFEDETIVKNKTYQSFKEGQIANPNINDTNKRLGETRLMNCGMKATIIEYFKFNNITVQFEDGTIIKNRIYNGFKKGEIDNPNFNKYIGETRMMNCGMNATIIEYFRSDNITVQFQDGTIVKNKTYNNFKNCSIANININGINKRLGETRMMNCGMKATIIEYFNAVNITVQFEDSTIIKNKRYNQFKKCEINNPNLKYFTIFKGTDKEFTSTLKEIANNFNLNYENIKYKINQYNMTIEEAMMTPLVKFKQNNLTYKGQKGTMRELCQKFDKNFIEVYNKVKYNHKFEWAMDSTEKAYEEK